MPTVLQATLTLMHGAVNNKAYTLLPNQLRKDTE